MPTLIGVINGVTYNEEDFLGVAYASSPGFFSAMRDIVAHVALGWIGLSGTSLSVGTGTKSLTIDSGGYAFAAGVPVRLIRVSDPAGTFMEGTVTAWDATTRAMDVDVTAVVGSGTHTDWRVVVVRSATVAGSSPLPIADGGTAAASVTGVLANFGLSRTRLAAWYGNAPELGSGSYLQLVGTAGSGDFVGHDNEYAITDSGGLSWSFETPIVGDLALVQNDRFSGRLASNDVGDGPAVGSIYTWDGSAWVQIVPPAQTHHTITSTQSFTAAQLVGSQVPIAIKSNTSAYTVTLPSAGGLPPAGRLILVNSGSAGNLTVNVSGGGTINGSASLVLAPGQAASLLYAGSTGVWVTL